MQKDETIVGYIENQGHVAIEAASLFVREHLAQNAKVIQLDSVKLAMMRLSHEDIDYLVVRDDRDMQASLPNGGNSEEENHEVVWHGEIPISYVIASPCAMELHQISALIMDDVVASHIKSSLIKAMGDSHYVRYGSADGDRSARKLKEQPDAYMRGTAVVCSPSACESARLRKLTDAFVDDGADTIRFVAIARRQ